jgi:predicted amidohydrolase YtcJ
MRSLVMVFTAAAVLFASQAAFAQRDAGAKVRGEYNFYGGAASSAMRSAGEYSANYREYAESAKPVNPEVAKEAADSIGQYITKAQKHMASMRTHAVGDKETLTALTSIDKHLAAAAKSHAEMRETCLKDNVDAGASMACCQTIDDHLAKAIAEHDKLMKRLAGNKSPTAKN